VSDLFCLHCLHGSARAYIFVYMDRPINYRGRCGPATVDCNICIGRSTVEANSDRPIYCESGRLIAMDDMV
jgi:hypothetical protein